MLLREAMSILGVSAESTLADTKAAYKRKALELHPDRNDSADANEAFQRLGAAYSQVRSFHAGGGVDGDGDDGTAPAWDQELRDMLSDIFGPNLSRSQAAAIASTLGPRAEAPPPSRVYTGPATKPDLAARIAATRAEVERKKAEALSRAKEAEGEAAGSS